MISVFQFSKEFDKDFNYRCMSQIDQLLEQEKCCDIFPKCMHPKHQTNEFLFEKNIKNFIQLKNTFLKCVSDYINSNNFNVVNWKSWAFKSEKGTFHKTTWHKHYIENKNTQSKDIQISGLFYLTETELGTIYEDEFFNYRIKPKLFTWYLWPSQLMHQPEPGYCNHNRYTIATSIIINKNDT